MPIRLLDSKRQYTQQRDALQAAVTRVLESGRYILGPEVESLEKEIAAECDCACGIGVASGTDALLLSLAALGVGPGDEVITTAFTFVSTAEVISLRGGVPVFADIDPKTYNIDPASAASRITPRTVGILPVDLYGQVANMEELRDLAESRRLWMVEDACQALGAIRGGKKAGSFCSLGSISFYPTKNLGACGDGGMVVTNDAALAERVRQFRYHGSSGRPGSYEHDYIGYNSRLDELQAAILRSKLPHLGEWTAIRRQTASFYRERVTSAYLELPEDTTAGHVWHQFTVRCSQRDALADHLKTRGIESKVYYPLPLHLQKTYEGLGYQRGSLPVTEKAALEVLSIPISHELTDAEKDQIVDALNAFRPV